MLIVYAIIYKKNNSVNVINFILSMHYPLLLQYIILLVIYTDNVPYLG